jgi:CRISPR-associated protein Csb1
VHVPATGSHGGVVAKGGIRRDATLSLAALRLLSAGTDADATRTLRRYVLGLSLVGFTAPVLGYFRQGCSLVLDASRPDARSVEEVHASGDRKTFVLSHEEALVYAAAVSTGFGVGESRTVDFDGDRAKRDTADGGSKKQGKKSGKKV